MNKLQKMGGIAGMITAMTFVFGMVLMFTVLEPISTGNLTENMKFATDNQGLVYLWNTVVYVVFGVFLVVLLLALGDRLKSSSSALVKTANIFGFIWAGLVIASGMVINIGLSSVAELLSTDPSQAGLAWFVIDTVKNGLGGGNEIVGGIWILLLSLGALKSRLLSKPLSFFGIIISIAGIVTIIPVLEMVGAIFGFGCIIWFTWVGIILLNNKTTSVSS